MEVNLFSQAAGCPSVSYSVPVLANATSRLSPAVLAQELID